MCPMFNRKFVLSHIHLIHFSSSKKNVYWIKNTKKLFRIRIWILYKRDCGVMMAYIRWVFDKLFKDFVWTIIIWEYWQNLKSTVSWKTTVQNNETNAHSVTPKNCVIGPNTGTYTIPYTMQLT